ncbi:glycosyltransferase family 2 protein [uncultured Desulfovibrio sp.]|uniref:glycosyltransferase family 2 protein n=1 Tax=uncultured Desulfovibrio sp. TaxID=167968 RepID=UPI0026178C6B|nr:glycosyltransferase family 2 protein [uncultured Desulfovibrio sp.]
MWGLFLLLAIAQGVLLWWLGRVGERLAREEKEELIGPATEADWPRAALIIPAAGSHPRMEEALTSLLEQDYPALLPVVVTATETEPAAELVQRLQKTHPSLRHVVAGEARGCGQKNHNSLKAVEAVGDAADVYVFCDSTHIARPDFVRQLVGPVAVGVASVTTGYHEVRPYDQGLVTMAYALCVQLMRYLQGLSRFTQPWGGAMCMSRESFARYKVRELWEANVVDDCSLAGVLLREGVSVRLCPGALLRTEAEQHPLAVWQAWMDRQVLFLKFCVRQQWYLLGGLCAVMALPPLLTVLSLLALLLGGGGLGWTTVSFLYLITLAAAMGQWRGLLGNSFALWRWMLAFGVSAAMFARVYVNSLRASGILWHGIWYEVGPGGSVRGMRR